MVTVNTVLEIKDGGNLHRVLWTDIEKDVVYLFDLKSRNMPMLICYSDVLKWLESGNAEIMTYDPYIKMAVESEISERSRQFRDQVWSFMEDIVLCEPGIYEKATRCTLVSEKIQETGRDMKVIHRYLKKYWLYGKSKNAFLPDFSNRGGKGKERMASSQSPKRGRPRKYSVSAGKNTDEETKRVFEKAIKKFYHTWKGFTFKDAYDMMLKEYYTKPVLQKDGTTKLEMITLNEIPTIRQFRYWYSKTYDVKEKITSRMGKSKYSLDHRAILGKSDFGVMGPGAKYQIDATVGDIYLVSSFNRANIIGRPVIYFIIDVFSRMVAGMYIGLEGPSWAGAMMAIANACSDKVKYCSDYGVEINESDWPCRHMPEAILGDRGEMESKYVETLINSFNVRIENTPPYRADMKGIVEQHFNTINTTATAFLPGHVKRDMKERGGRDYRLDAKLDMRQFTKIMILSALNHNNEHFLEGYERDADMIADDVQPIPSRLWEWGIRNRSGLLRAYPEEQVKLCLMPRGTATVSAKGIYFKGIYYISDRAVAGRWFETARAKGSFKVDVSYDPRDMSRIYSRLPGENSYDVCHLADWEEKYRGRRLEDIIYLFETEKLASKANENSELKARLNLNAEIENVVKEAEELARQTAVPSSKSERTKNIRANRSEEKEKNRKSEAFVIGGDDVMAAAASVDENDEISPVMKMIVKDLEGRRNDEGRNNSSGIP